MTNQLYLGVARKDITPEIGGNLYGYRPDLYSDSIHDNLTVTAFAFKSADVCAVMVSATVGGVKTTLTNEIRTQISKKHNIPFGNIVISATHTHSGPNISGVFGWGDVDFKYYDEIFLPNLFKAVMRQLKTLLKCR